MKWKKIVQILLSTVAILLIIAALISWRLHVRLEKQITAVRAAGDPVSLADLDRSNVDAADNAATYLARIREDGENLYREIDAFAHADDFSWRDGLDQEQLDKTAAGLAAYPKVFPAIEQAAQCSIHAWPLDYAQGPSEFFASVTDVVGPSRNVARLLDCRGRYLLAMENPEEAARNDLVGLKLARLQDQEPTLVVFLVNIACRSIAAYSLNGVLQTANLTPETHVSIEEELAQHDSMQQFVHALRTERALGIESFRTLPVMLGTLQSSWNNYMDIMEQQIALGAKSHYELADVQKIPSKGITKTIDPAIAAAREAMNRSRATLRCLRILNQIRARNISPDSLSAEALGLPQEILVDPYNGKPLTIRSTPEGWIVYSVGQNNKDDGGKLHDLSDIGVGPPEVMF